MKMTQLINNSGTTLTLVGVDQTIFSVFGAVLQ